MPFTKNEECQFPKVQSEYRRHYKSTVQNDYVWKYRDPEQFNLPCARSTPLMKRYDECKMKFPPKPLKEYINNYNNEYVWKDKPKDFSPPAPAITYPLPKLDVNLNPSKSGYAKYLDLMATTNMLNYVDYDIEVRKGIANKDHITAYNWFGQDKPIKGFTTERPPNLGNTKELMCEDTYSLVCPTKKRTEFHSEVKPVPHSGMTTEFRDKYGKTVEEIKFNPNKLKLPNVGRLGNAVVPLSTESENYGSKRRVQAHVDITSPNLHYIFS